MSDPFITLGRLFMLIFVPVMLLFPLVFAALVPNRAADDSARIKARGMLLTLAMSTAALLAIWVGLVLTGLRFNFAMVIAGFWWPWFFPLWFFLAMPAIVAKNPHWGWTVGSGSASGGVRTASLVNRERTSPVTRAMWAVPITLFVLILAAIAARGLLPFGVGPYPGDSAIDPEAARVAYAEVERSRWIFSLVVFGSVFGFVLAILPRSLRRTLSEPEPMDAAGSAELLSCMPRSAASACSASSGAPASCFPPASVRSASFRPGSRMPAACGGSSAASAVRSSASAV